MENLETKIQSTIINFLIGARMFTAYDVTKTLRNEGHWAVHNEVREIVHRAMEVNSFYKQATIDMNGVPTVLYHSILNVPEDYDKNWVPQNWKDDSNQNGWQSFTVTKEGRLNLPPSMADRFSGDVYVSIVQSEKGKSLCLSHLDKKAITKYTVNSDGRIRIGKKVLDLLGESNSYRLCDKTEVLGHSVIIISQ